MNWENMNRVLDFARWLCRRKPKSVEGITTIAIDKMVELKHVANRVAIEKQYTQHEGYVTLEGDVTLAPKLQKIAKLTGVRVGGKYHTLPKPIIVQPGDHVLIVFGGPSMKDDKK